MVGTPERAKDGGGSLQWMMITRRPVSAPTRGEAGLGDRSRRDGCSESGGVGVGMIGV